MATIVIHHVESSSRAGTSQRFAQETVTLGRLPNCDVAFDPESDLAVSGAHAEIVCRENAAFVRDVGSRNGTFVNGSRIDAETRLGPQDVVGLGEDGPVLRVEVAAEASKKHVGAETLQRVVEQVVHKERRRTRSAVIMLAAGTIFVVAAGAFLIWRQQKHIADKQAAVKSRAAIATKEIGELKRGPAASSSKLQNISEEVESLKRELAQSQNRLQRQINQVQSTIQSNEEGFDQEEAKRKLQRLREQLRDVESALRRHATETNWPRIVEKYERSIFLCYYENEKTFGIGSAFAISADGLLATNAHVVDSLLRNNKRLVIQNKTGRIFKVEDAKRDPGYNGTSASSDVGLLKVAMPLGETLTPLPLASTDEVATLRPGTQIGTLGYPGELIYEYYKGIDFESNQAKTAQATFKDGWIGQLTDFHYQPADPEKSCFVQHSASVSHGTSGSPVLDAAGKVIAINNSGRDVALLSDNASKRTRVHSTDPAEIARAIRIDVLHRFRREIGW